MDPIFNKFERYKTEKLSLDFDVKKRLQSLSKWKSEFDSEDRILSAKVRDLNPSNKVDIQTGEQIARHRRLLRHKQVLYPIEVNPDFIQEVGFSQIRENLELQFVGLTKEERSLWLSNLLFIMTPDLRDLYAKIDRVRAYRSFGQQRGFLLGGPSGMGKTTFLSWYQYHSQPVINESMTNVKVVRIDAPVNNQSGKPLYQLIINATGDKYYQTESEHRLLGRLIWDFEVFNVELLIIDEIQHIRTNEMRRRVLEISNRTKGVPIICASCHPQRWVEGDEEVHGRWNDYFPLEPYKGERLNQLLAFIELLLPFSKSSNLPFIGLEKNSSKINQNNSRSQCNLIEKLTKGILRDIMILIYDSCEKAIKNDIPNITPELLIEVWSEIQKNNLDRVIN